jgi:hypothetical protein
VSVYWLVLRSAVARVVGVGPSEPDILMPPGELLDCEGTDAVAALRVLE